MNTRAWTAGTLSALANPPPPMMSESRAVIAEIETATVPVLRLRNMIAEGDWDALQPVNPALEPSQRAVLRTPCGTLSGALKSAPP